MLAKIVCKECCAEGQMSFIDPVYQGPYKCWKCRTFFNIRIENNVLKSIQSLSSEEYERHQQIEQMRNRAKGGLAPEDGHTRW